MNSATGTAPKEKEIPEWSNELAKAIENTGVLVDELDKLLSPIMANNLPSDISDIMKAVPEETICIIASYLRAKAQRIIDINIRLRSIINRVQL